MAAAEAAGPSGTARGPNAEATTAASAAKAARAATAAAHLRFTISERAAPAASAEAPATA